MLESEYDVVVVGAGPGGSATAKRCAELGLSVAMLEKRHAIGLKCCGEGLSSDAVKFLGQKIPQNCIAQTIDGAIVYAPNGKKIVIDDGKTVGYVLERKKYDKWLAEQAARAGTRVQTGTAVTGLIKQKDFVKGVKAEFGGDEFSVGGKVVVAADGVESKVARWAGLNTTIKLINIDSGFQYEMVDIDLEDKHKIILYFGNKIVPRGYCLLGNSEVITEDSVKHISEIKTGEKVHNLLGWTPVSATSERDYNGKIVKITPFMFNTEVGMTEDHLVYVWNKKEGFVWKKARELAKGKRGGHGNGDYLIFPIPIAEPITNIDFSEYFDGISENGMIYPVGRNQFGAVFKYKHGLKQRFPLSIELMELFGYFVSEGNTNSSGIIISNTNMDIVERISEIGKNIFDFEPSIWYGEREKACYQVNFNSRILKAFFAKEFGIGCKNKRIPRWFFGLPIEMKKAFLIGLFRGDGCKEISSDGYDVLSYISTSKQLIYDLWMLLSTMGIVGAIGRIKKKNAYRLRIRGNQLEELADIFGICKHGSRANRGFFVKDNMIFMGIRKIKEEQFSGKVYDIESGGSFCPGFIVHNCWIFPKGEDRANVGIGIGGIGYGKTAKQYLDEWIASKQELKKGSITEVNSGGIPVGGFLENMVGNGLVVVGDAAHQVNPIHGGGIKEAAIAGRIAGEVIAEAIKADDVSQKKLSKYNEIWWKERGEHLKKVEKLRQVVEKLSDNDFNLLADVLAGEDLVEFTRGSGLGKLAKILMKKPKLALLAKHLL